MDRYVDREIEKEMDKRISISIDKETRAHAKTPRHADGDP